MTELVCFNVCSYCEQTVASVKTKAADVQTALNQLKRRKTKCKDHPDVPLIRHVRKAELGPIGEKKPGFKGPRYY